MANTDDLPWSSGLTMTVAMNDAQFDSSVACGMCITFQGVGTGIGTEPIPGKTTLLCPFPQFALPCHHCILLSLADSAALAVMWT